MPSKIDMAEFRSKLFSVASTLGSARTADIAAAFRKRHPTSLRRVNDTFVDRQLAVEIERLGRRHRRTLINAKSPDLFASYPGIPAMISLPGSRDSSRTMIRKASEFWTVGDLKNWNSRKVSARRARHDTVPDINRLLKDVLPLSASDDDLVIDLLRGKRKVTAKSDAG